MIAPTLKRRSSRRGFTLTEMLVVVAIIVLLASISVPIGFGLYEAQKRNAALSVVKGTLEPAVSHYRISHSEPPASLDDVAADSGMGLSADQLMDPWNRPYHYSPESSHGKECDIWSDCGGKGDEASWAGNWMKQ